LRLVAVSPAALAENTGVMRLALAAARHYRLVVM
jgi:hypothetical protein